MSQWPMSELGELISFRGGGTPSKDKPEYWGDDISWATVKDFKGLYLDKTQDSISEQGLKSSSANLIPAGHVIIPTRMALGKAAINTIDLAINQDLRALLPQKPLDTKYLLHAVLGLSDQIEANGSGATVKGITQEKLKKLRVPYPPLEEQKRIAKILDAADALRAKRRESLAQLDALLQSTFLYLFGDPIANPYGWDMGVVGDLLESANYGTSKKASESAGRYPILRMGNITYEGGWDMSSMKYIDLEGKEEEKYLVRKGDILFNRTNSRELVGKTAVYRSDEPIAFAGYLVRARACWEADPEYIAAFMNTPQTKSRLVSMCKSIVGMANINAKEFQAIPIPVPPLDLQKKFSTIVEAVFRQKEVLNTHLEEFDVLFSALQQKAFSGNL